MVVMTDKGKNIMNDMQYKKSGATVSVSQDGKTQIYKIERGGKTLEMSFTREQKIENLATHGGYMAPVRTRGDCVVSYDIVVRIGDAENKFAATYSKEVSKIGENEQPTYDSGFEEKGIPAEEYKAISKALAEQNTAVAQVFNEYILDAEDLQKANNLQQSIFNQKLDEFLR